MTEKAEADRRYMRRALALARRGRGRVAPNPMVGALLVRDREVVGEGWHAEFGGPHAEVAALEAAGVRADGATLYVTLEPCAHTGKTPPCAPAVARAGVRRVVVGCRDPDPAARGGSELLRGAGIEVAEGVEGRACAELLAGYLWSRAGRGPFVALKLALSLDGALARRVGVRSPVTGERAERWVHRFRAGFDAILVGRGTVEVDDPLLTVRGDVEPRRPPVRVIFDSALRVPVDARVVTTTGGAPTWLVCAPGAPSERRVRLEDAGVRVLEVSAGPGGVDARAALDRLAAEGVGTVLAEGGARVARSLLEGDRVHEMHLLYAPVLFGADAPGGFGGAVTGSGSWRLRARQALGPDTRLGLESQALAELLDRWSRPGPGG